MDRTVTARERVRPRRRTLRDLGLVAGALALAGCGAGDGPGDPVAARGRQVYLAQCTACHAQDPARDGPLGPAVKGASRELLEARIMRGTYPPGYAPKRNTAVMPPTPSLAADIPALAAYLR